MSAKNQLKFNYPQTRANNRSVSTKNIRQQFRQNEETYAPKNIDKANNLMLGRRGTNTTNQKNANNKTMVLNRETSLARADSVKRSDSNYRPRVANINNLRNPIMRTPEKNLNYYQKNHTNIVTNQQQNFDSRQIYQTNCQNEIITNSPQNYVQHEYPQQMNQPKVNNTIPQDIPADPNLDGESIVQDAKIDMTSSQLTDFNFNFDNNFNHEILGDPMRDFNLKTEGSHQQNIPQKLNFVNPEESGFLIPEAFTNIEDSPETNKPFPMYNQPNNPQPAFPQMQYQPNTYIVGNQANYPANQRPAYSRHNEDKTTNNPLSLTYNTTNDTYNNNISSYLVKNNPYKPYSKGEESTKVSSKYSKGSDQQNQFYHPVTTPKQQNMPQDVFKDISPVRYEKIPITLSDETMEKTRKANYANYDMQRYNVEQPQNLPRYPARVSNDQNWVKNRTLEDGPRAILPQYTTLIPKEAYKKIAVMINNLSQEKMRKKIEETIIENEYLKNDVHKTSDLISDSEIYQEKVKNLNSVLVDNANDKKSLNERYKVYISDKLNEINIQQNKISYLSSGLNNVRLNCDKANEEYDNAKDREEDLPIRVKASCEFEQKQLMEKYEYDTTLKFAYKFKDYDPGLIQSQQILQSDNDRLTKVNQDLKSEYKQVNKIARRSGVFNVK